MDFLIKTFIEKKSGDDNRLKRKLCGQLSGVFGIVMNAAIGVIKLIIGTVTGSVAVTADAVNNLADAASSVITMIGFALASRKSDKEHPFGHARIEYMTGAIVSAIIIVIGVELILSSYRRIITPMEVGFDLVSVALLVVALVVMLWLWRFNGKLYRYIESASLKATAVENRNDVITTVGVMAALFVERFLGLHVDGFVGAAIGAFIIYSGLNMVKETVAPLLGQSPDPETIREITELVRKRKEALGIHDLIVHDYGPGHIFASVHIEVDSRADILLSHEMIDEIEQEAQDSLGVMLVGHMDPVDTQNPKEAELRLLIASVIESVEGAESFHDLRVVPGVEQMKVIFDVVVSHDNADEAFEAVRKEAQEVLSASDPRYIVVIGRDLDYVTTRKAQDT